MLARIAHELFWLGRNLARAEHTARMLEGVFQTDLQARPVGPVGVTFGWRSTLATMGVHWEPGPVRRDEVLLALTLDLSQPTSIAACVARAREQARTVRDVISAEMWEALNTTHLRLGEGDPAARLAGGPYAVLQQARERCALFWGLMNRTMLRDEARSFLVAGGRIESADMVLRMLRVAVSPGPAGQDDDEARDGEALALLQAVGGFQAFRRAVPAPPNAGPVTRFLLYERGYPDSVAAALASAQVMLEDADHNPRTSQPVLRLSRLGADLELRARAPEGDDLAAVCESVQAELAAVDRDIAERYFAGAAPLGVVATV